MLGASWPRTCAASWTGRRTGRPPWRPMSSERLTLRAQLEAAMANKEELLRLAAPTITTLWLNDAIRRCLALPPQLANTDGDPLEFMTLHYRVAPAASAAETIAALSGVPDLRAEVGSHSVRARTLLAEGPYPHGSTRSRHGSHHPRQLEPRARRPEGAGQLRGARRAYSRRRQWPRRRRSVHAPFAASRRARCKAPCSVRRSARRKALSDSCGALGPGKFR